MFLVRTLSRYHIIQYFQQDERVQPLDAAYSDSLNPKNCTFYSIISNTFSTEAFISSEILFVPTVLYRIELLLMLCCGGGP